MLGKYFNVCCNGEEYHYKRLNNAIRKLKTLNRSGQIRYDECIIDNSHMYIGSSSPYIFYNKESNKCDILPDATDYYKNTDEYKYLYNAAETAVKKVFNK